MPTSIEFENISKQYRLGLVSTKTLSHDLNRWWKTRILRQEDPYLKIGSVNDRASKADSEYVWALKDINFKVEQGDVVGIIGKNGAGKSTLLKLLSRVTNPTTGVIRAKGRIASLLEVGTGFHQELTGRENIYMNGAIMGMSKSEIRRKLDEIVDFSGCERYIDTPVKRYSSGMTVRLGFAIAAHLDPDILVVDEVLAVGDAEFQKKAIGKMQDVSKGEGRTVLFVSHNMASVKSLCRKGILLDNGMINKSGDINDIVDQYRITCHQIESSTIDLNSIDRQTEDVHISEFIVLSGENGTVYQSTNKPLSFKISISSKRNLYVYVRITLFDMNETRVCAIDSSDLAFSISLKENSTTTVLVNMIEPIQIKPGKYKINVSVKNGLLVLDHVVGVTYLTINDDDFYGHGVSHDHDAALCLKHHEWKIQ